MMPAVSAKTMRELDRMAAAEGISTLSLMEKAGEVVVNKAVELLGGRKGSRVAVFCGKGNNGGDGFVAARKLRELSFDVVVYLLCGRNEVKNETEINLRSFIKTKGNLKEIKSEADVERLNEKFHYSLVIDGILGTGFSGSVSGYFKSLIELLNSKDIPILAVDVPSGLNATTGEASPAAIKANSTVSFALPKKGFYEKEGPKYTGLLSVVNIGFPEELLKKAVEYEKTLCAT
jgi:NAD(P)H-hydrate epimerase